MSDQWIIRSDEGVLMFIDMVGSSEFKKENRGIAGAEHVLEHNRLAHDTALNYMKDKGRQEWYSEINKLIGDGLLLYFRTDKGNTASQCELALDTAKHIIDQFISHNNDPSKNSLHTRIIIDWSEVVFRYDAPVQKNPEIISGNADFAAYLLGWAKEEQILVTESFRDKLIGSKKIGGKLRDPSSKDIFFFSGKTIYRVEGNDPLEFPKVSPPRSNLPYWEEKDDIRNRHEEMRDSFVNTNKDLSDRIEIEAVWFADWDNLEEYLIDEENLVSKTKNLVIRRLINTKTVDPNFVDWHLKRMSNFHITDEVYRSSDSIKGYQCKHTDVQSFEVMITLGQDHTPKEAILTIHKSKDQKQSSLEEGKEPTKRVIPRFAAYFNGEKHSAVVNALHDWFEKMWEASDRDLFHELVWGSPEDYDKIVQNPENKILQEFIRQEEEYVRKILSKFEKNKVALIDVGSGTGRIFKRVEDLSDRFSYRIGIDIAKRMVDYASKNFQNDNVIFLQLDGVRLTEFFGAGTVSLDDLKREFKDKHIERIDGKKFHDSVKIICCLLNTLGTIDKKSREKIIRGMVECGGKNSLVILSFLNGDKFRDVSRTLYNKSFKKLAGYFDNNNFDDDHQLFTTKRGYVSRWFKKSKIKEMLSELTDLDIPENPEPIKYEGMDIGYIYVLEPSDTNLKMN